MSKPSADAGPSPPPHRGLDQDSAPHLEPYSRHSTGGESSFAVNATGPHRDAKHSEDGYSGDTVAEAVDGYDGLGQQRISHRRVRNRKSGGFILDSVFPTSKRWSSLRKGDTLDAKGKRRFASEGARDGAPPVADPSYNGTNPPRREQNRDSVDGHSNDAQSVPSSDSRHSRSPSPTRRNVPSQSAQAGAPRSSGSDAPERSVSATPAIDPTQIVNMALNLSESRRRVLSAGQYLAPPPGPNGRIVSTGQPAPSRSLSSSYYSQGLTGSLRQHLQQQRRVSRNMSPGTGRSSPSSRQASGAGPPYILDPNFALEHGQPLDYKFSDATLARAMKARAHIELFYEYRRLLQFLPPLKPNASAPGNSHVTATSIIGTPNVQLTRVPSFANQKYELGRQYNVLQSIRNRKTRTRERRPLTIPAERFENVDRVRNWVDAVSRYTSRSGYRQDDSVLLPDYSIYDGGYVKSDAPQSDTAERDAPRSQITKRPRTDYVFTPAELLADVYWMEHGDNKYCIENRFGNKIFSAPKPPSLTVPRLSKEESRDSDRKADGSVTGATASDSHTAEDSDGGSERGRKRRLFRGKHLEDPAQSKKHGWHVSRARSRSSSDLSESEHEQTTRRPKNRRLESHEENTGPLARHLQDMVEKEVKQHSATTPSVDSPDQWGFAHIPLSTKVTNTSEASNRDSLELNGNSRRGLFRRSLDTSRPMGFRSHKTSDSLEVRSSYESLSPSPSSPVIGRETTDFAADLSAPPSRKPSVSRKPKKSRLGIFRSDASIRSQNTEGDESQAEERDIMPMPSLSVESQATNGNKEKSGTVRHLLSHKRNESRHSVKGRTDLESRKNGKEPKEPSSAVTRFFKGVRTEGSKVGEFIFKKDRPASDSSSTSSDSDDSSSSDSDSGKKRWKRLPRVLDRSSTSETVETITSQTTEKPRYHLDLPSFRSSNAPDPTDTSGSGVEDDPVYAQQLAQRGRGRSARFEQLAPPRMDLSGISSKSPTPTEGSVTTAHDPKRLDSYDFKKKTHHRSPSNARRRLQEILKHPGAIPFVDLYPPSGLAKVSPSPSPSRRSGSRPTLSGKRHWSISDQERRASHSSNDINLPSEIARTQALLLCSAIKARELYRRANSVRDSPPDFLQRAADTAKVTLIAVPRKEEHVLAARILSNDLETTMAELRSSADTFRKTTCASLETQIAATRRVLNDELTPRVRACTDEADAFTKELTGSFPLKVKDVYDRVGALMRRRRRRLRWMRRAGFALLEWLLLLAMWGVWLVFVIINTVKGVTFGFVKGVRWLLWL